jgi:hypothetical protein
MSRTPSTTTADAHATAWHPHLGARPADISVANPGIVIGAPVYCSRAAGDSNSWNRVI